MHSPLGTSGVTDAEGPDTRTVSGPSSTQASYAERVLLGVDVGGTFTDAVLFDGSDLYSAKAPTTPGEESEGVHHAIEAVLEHSGASAGEIERFVHGMTVGTNALLEERGSRTALVATRGFEDVLEIARQDRPSLYRLCEPKPKPLVAPGDRMGCAGRLGPEGELDPLPADEPARIADAVGALDVESVAVCLLFSYLDPTHEESIAAAIRERYPNLHVSTSHDVLPRFREYERTSTTVIDAYLSPLLGRYLGRLAEASGSIGIPEPEIMRSSGGVAPWNEAATPGRLERAFGTCRRRRRRRAHRTALRATVHAVGLDMGGTSCDVCVIEDGHAGLTESREIAGPRHPTSDGGRAHGGCRRRARSAGSTTAAPCASGPSRPEPIQGLPVTAAAAPRPPSPMRTSCSDAWPPSPAWPGAWTSTWRRGIRGGPRAWLGARARRGRNGGWNHPAREQRDGARASRRHRQPRSRSTGVRPAAVRRGRTDARGGARGGDGDDVASFARARAGSSRRSASWRPPRAATRRAR